jgi:hypothetical protein
MAILLFILIMLSVVIFIYESIILPSIRLRIRYSLFELRDKLRFLKVEKKDVLDDTAFKYLQDFLNTLLAFLHRYDVMAMFAAARFFNENPTLYKRVIKRQELLDGCSVEEFQQIRRECVNVAIGIMAANSFGLLMVLAPIVAIFKGFKYIKDKTKDITTKLFSVPEGESDFLDKVCLG